MDNQASTMTVATKEQLAEERIDLLYRDNCSGLLIPLNRCRQQTQFAPWKCTDERHAYEKCQYEDYMKRMKQAQKAKLAAEDDHHH